MLAPNQRRRKLTMTARRLAVAAIAVAVCGGLVYAFLPPVIMVDMATVAHGPLRVTVREEGKTRIKERYVISSPLAGRVLRIELDPGDPVEADKTLLATIEPNEPSLLDVRSLAQAKAKVEANEAALKRAEAELKRSEAAAERADAHYRRMRTLRETHSASQEELEDAELAERANNEALAAAKFDVNIASFELEQAKAALLRFQPKSETNSGETGTEWQMQIHSPISGRVLSVFQESAAVVTPGTPLVEVGDPHDLEIVVDVLSEDAVKVRPGNLVDIEQWGGGKILPGIVRTVEPQAFTKVSALGVEEQRVNIIIDFTCPTEEREPLGDQYRVEADIIIWQSPDVVKVPVSCLFRKGDQWAVFVVDNGVAKLQTVEIGQRNNLEAEVLQGLEPGQTVIVHPGDQVQEGTKVSPRV